MFKHPENTMAANPKTLTFSAFSEFSVGTAVRIAATRAYLRTSPANCARVVEMHTAHRHRRRLLRP
jgi:hypothetical protein